MSDPNRAGGGDRTRSRRPRRAHPEPDDTYLIRTCTLLRRKPVADFTTEDLRIMLGQQIGVPILLPLAVRVLLDDPLAEGHFYPGDLLTAVLRLPDSAWAPADRRALASRIAGLQVEDQSLQSLVAAFAS